MNEEGIYVVASNSELLIYTAIDAIPFG